MVAAISSPLLFTENLKCSVIITRRFAVASGGGNVLHLEMLGILFVFSFVPSTDSAFLRELEQNTILMLAI